MKKSILFIALVAATGSLFAQKAGQQKTTTSGSISFDATTAKDALPKADNKTVIASINPKKGTVAFEAIIKNFSFANPMMQEHFNSATWMDSEKFPTASFKGNLTNLSAIDFKNDGTYAAEVAGDLTIHGITKAVKTAGSISVSGKSITVSTNFTVQLSDYGVNGPAIAAGKVANETKISVAAEMK